MAGSTDAGGRPPNIVFLLPDQQRADTLGFAGDPVAATPRLDRLAREGVVFDAAYCDGPLCMPSRASLMTGLAVAEHGVETNAGQVPAHLPTMAQHLQRAGYDTVCIGKTHFWEPGHEVPDVELRQDLMHGYGFTEVDEIQGKMASLRCRDRYTRELAERGLFDAYRASILATRPSPDMSHSEKVASHSLGVRPSPLPAEDHVDRWVGREAAEWVRRRRATSPFFLWVGFPGPHSPFDPPAAYLDRFAGAQVPVDSLRRPDVPPGLEALADRPVFDQTDPAIVSDDAVRVSRRSYYAEVAMIDEAIGEVLDALEERGMARDTWVVYTSDHGEMLGTHGMYGKTVLYEPSVRVPLVVRPTGCARPDVAGAREPGLVQLLDVVATMLELACALPLSGSPGQSLLPGLGRAGRRRERIVSESSGMAMVFDGRRKLVVDRASGRPLQLFDLAADPDEDRNLLGEDGAAEVAAALTVHVTGIDPVSR